MKKKILIPLITFLFFLVHCNQLQSWINNDSCSQLAGSEYKPITFGKILCVASDLYGTFFVLDKVDYTIRCFVSRNDTLYRTYLSGSSIMNEEYYFLLLNDQQLIFHSKDTWSDVFLVQGKCEKCDSLFSSHLRNSKSLESVDAGWNEVCSYLRSGVIHSVSLRPASFNNVSDYQLRNFNPITHVEYLAKQESRFLLVTTPKNDWNGEVVVHFGLPEEMELCYVNEFVRAADGGTTWIGFRYKLKNYKAYFGVKWDSTGIIEGNTFLLLDNDTLLLEQKDPDREILKNLGFDCSHKVDF